jgi:hypothetical protein
MANLLTHRMRRLKRRIKQHLHDLRTFTHPAVKIAIVVVLIALTVAAVVYALRSAPANEQPADPGISQPQPAAADATNMHSQRLQHERGRSYEPAREWEHLSGPPVGH